MSEQKFRVSVITSCFHGETYLSSFINQLISQTIFPELEWVLIHNEPAPHEMEIVKDFQERFPEKIKHLIINPVEPLSASWNRGWKAASAEYLSFWNLDDCRSHDSLQRQVETLEQNPDCMMTYGDFFKVPRYGSDQGQRKNTPSFNLHYFRRNFPGGAFMVWRRTVADLIGYFDEQLYIACDFDLAVRAAVYGLNMRKTEGVVGYFTDEGMGLSTIKGTNERSIETAIIQLRYAIFDKVDPHYVLQAKNRRISEILVDGSWLPLNMFLKSYSSYVNRRMFLRKLGGIRRFLHKMFRM